MIFSVRHITSFRYEPAVRESIMEVRLQPRSDGNQRCLNFALRVDPAANIMQYRDFSGNTVHHFDIAAAHTEMTVSAESSVEVQSASAPRACDCGDWDDLDALLTAGDYWDMLLPSHFARSTATLEELAKELHFERRGNPLELISDLNTAIFRLFAYVPHSTKVDSPIDEALRTRQGVCQDFAHIMIAGLRGFGLPAAYVSGFLRTVPRPGAVRLAGADAMHAWVTVWCGGVGWWGLDPTNAMIASEDHVVLAIGRDYADVAPIDGVVLASGEQRLTTAVDVIPVEGST